MSDLEKRMDALEVEIAALKLMVASGGRGPVDPGDLDSEYGNFEVRKDPPFWIKDGGASYEGARLSDCPAEYLDKLAEFLDWGASKDEETGYKNAKGKATAPYKRKDAARARGWAARKRGPGRQVARGASDDLPF